MRDPCPRCGKPIWVSGSAYGPPSRVGGVMFVPPAKGEVCECLSEDEQLHARLAHIREELSELEEGLDEKET